MDKLYERIAMLCTQNGISITTMCKESGASRAPLSDLKMGRSKRLSTETLSKIATYFGVSVDYLLTGEQKEKPSANSDERDDFIAFYGEVKKDLDDSDLNDLKIFMKAKAEYKRNLKNDKGGRG